MDTSSHKKTIDTSNMNWVDMALLKKQDPFMYYSIPGNRDANLPGKDVDLSDLDLPELGHVVSKSFTGGCVKKKTSRAKVPRRHSITVKEALTKGTSVHVQEERRVPALVERRSAISFETTLYNESLADTINEEIARLQVPRRSSSIRSSRRGSLFQDFLVAMFRGLEDFDANGDSSAGP